MHLGKFIKVQYVKGLITICCSCFIRYSIKKDVFIRFYPTKGEIQLLIYQQVIQLRKIINSTTNSKRMGKWVPPTIFSLVLIAPSRDIDKNPGPVQIDIYLKGNSEVFLWGNCQQPVTWNCKDVHCDMCNEWFHADCKSINDPLYDKLGYSSAGIAAWKCLLCENLNVTNNSISRLYSLETSNPFSTLDNSNMSNISFSMA
jgi:hypothetical protein